MAFANAFSQQGEKGKTHNASIAMNSPVTLWPATLAFLIVSSVLFAWLFEWNRYQVITAYRLNSLSMPNLPNVIIIFFEGFRLSAIGPTWMRELDEWSQQGLRLERHYSGSNCSHLGLFSLLYGRSPLRYYQNLVRDIPPQLLESPRRSGYRITFLTSGETKGFRGLDRYLNDTYCDQILVAGIYNLKEMNEWPDSDRRKLARLQSMVSAPRDQPQ